MTILTNLIVQACGSEKRHAEIIRSALQEAHRVTTIGVPTIPDFVAFILRKLKIDESLIVTMPDLASFRRPYLNLCQEIVQEANKTIVGKPARLRLYAKPYCDMRTKQPLLLILSHYSFRVEEIVYDVWRATTPGAPDDAVRKMGYGVNALRIAYNLAELTPAYSLQDILDCISLIGDKSAFFLRAFLLFHADIEPQPFIDLLESKGFHVAIVLNETPSNEKFPEYDFIKRLQGLVIARSAEELMAAEPYTDHLIQIAHAIPLPTPVDSGRPAA